MQSHTLSPDQTPWDTNKTKIPECGEEICREEELRRTEAEKRGLGKQNDLVRGMQEMVTEQNKKKMTKTYY